MFFQHLPNAEALGYFRGVDKVQPFQGKKKGADTGIDGLKIFRDLDKKEVRKIIVSVKGGENVGPAMVKHLFENSPAL